MKNTENIKCLTCGKKAHNFEKEEAFDCVPPKETLKFGQYEIDKNYRDALYSEFPFYNSEEVVGSFLGHNPNFPSQDEWHNKENEDE
jgi:ribosomal protein L37E